MKKISRVFLFVMTLTAILISACGGATTATSAGSGKGQASLVEFTGVIEAIDGNQWTVGGQVITVDPSVLRDGPFQVGDTVKVEVEVQADGSVVVTRVEAPAADANSNDVNSNDANSNDDNSNDANSNDDNSNDSNSNDDNSNGGLVFDNSGTEAFGTVDSITIDTVVIGGQTFTVANGAEFKDQILPGDFVKVHFSLNADGTLSITEIETWDPALVSDGNSNDDNGNDDNSNDDNGNDDSNDDSNDDDDDDDNGNDD
ncbi:MAG: DUF5666 domain-containing protein [Anaerolineales bacterium]|nr:DUF5666 domain-containing protein [Anaerolineales bacterium]